MSEGLGELIGTRAEALVRDAQARGVTCGCAESCTGGLVSGAITAVSGSSAILMGGIVSYDPRVKHAVLDVEQAIIDDPARGVVSEDCARQMAQGARRVLSCDLAVSITGIAGPSGAEPGKPVGTVWFGLAAPSGTHCDLQRFGGDRHTVRLQAVAHALKLLHDGVMEI